MSAGAKLAQAEAEQATPVDGRTLAGGLERAARTRVGWGIADQALSSATNFALAMVVARSVDAVGFGAFGLAFTGYLLAVGTVRALVNEPLAMRFSASDSAQQRTACALAVGTSLALGIVAGVTAVLFALASSGVLRNTLLPLGLCLPALLAQDSWRSAFLTLGRPRSAFVNDLVWAIAQAVGLVFVLGGDPSPGKLVAVWGGASAVAAGVGCLQTGLRPVVGGVGHWLREHRRLWPTLGSEFWAMTGIWQITLVAVAGIAGLDAVGAIRGAQTVLGPLTLLFLAVPLVFLPEAARVQARAPEHLFGLCVRVGGALAILGTVAGVGALLIPDGVGQEILGSTWEGTRGVLLPIALLLASTGANLGALLGLRAMAATKVSLRARLQVSPLIVVGGVAGGMVAGAPGAAVGLASANWVATLVWWRALRRAARKGDC